jgi:hypothetical protein
MGYEETEMLDRPQAALERLPERYRAAAQKNKTLSQLLEDDDPSHKWSNPEDRAVRAFGRVLRASGFRFRSDPSEGIWADTWETIYSHEQGRALLPEWGRSVWRKALNGGYSPQVGSQSHRRVLGSQEDAQGSALRPIVDAAGVYQNDLEPGIQLGDLVALTTPIDGDTYRRTFLLDSSADSLRRRRVQEKSDIPRASIELSDKTIRTFKYGRGIEASYEVIRRVPVDKIGLYIAREAIQVEADRVAQAIDVLINGDGTGSTAADNFTTTALDSVGGAALSVKSWLAFRAKWAPPYTLTHIFAREAELVNLQLLQMPNNNPFLAQINGEMGFGGITPLQDLNGAVVRYGQTDSVPAGVYLGIDQRIALERVTEIGSDIQETMRFIERQTEALFFTDNDGFAVLDEKANKTLTVV